MGIMSKLGEGAARRPTVPFAILIIITAAMGGVIAMNPPSFDMEEGSFRPDNDMMRAQTLISESFASTASIISMADARGTDGDIFTAAAFVSVLEYELSLAEMKYADLSGSTPYYADLPRFMIVSPVKTIAEAAVQAMITMGAPIVLPVPSAFPTNHDYLVVYYETLIDAITVTLPAILPPGATATLFLRGVAYGVLSDPAAAMMKSLLTSDLKLGPGLVTGTYVAHASGCMISLMITDTAVEGIQNGELGFEKDVISSAKGFNASHPGCPTVRAVGMETMTKDIGKMAQDDISSLLPIALVVMIVLLLIIYRDASDTLVALLGLVIAIVWTFGIASLMGIAMSTIAIAVPILILALGIDYSLHLVFRYREERSSGKEPNNAIGITMGSVGRALVLATATTAIAFLSYLTSEMSALADFGLMCAIGIVCAFGSMMLLIPTTQVMRDRRAEKKGKDPNAAKRYKRQEDESKDTLGKISGIGGKMAAKNPWAVLGCIAVLVALCGYSATNLSYDFNMYDFIPEGTEAHDTITYMADNYSTTTSTTSVLVYADPWDINTVKAIEDSLNNMADPQIRGLRYNSPGPPDAEHIGTALKVLGEKLTGADPGLGSAYSGYYGTVFYPATGKLRPTATQAGMDELKKFVYEDLPAVPVFGPQLAMLVDSVLSSVVHHEGEPLTRIILSMTADIEGNNDAILGMKGAIDAACEPLDAVGGHVTTGQYVIMAATMTEMNKSQMTSLMITIAMVLLILTIVMYLTHRSLFLGAMATIPTLVSVVMVWGTMAAMNMPLNVMTLTMASLTVGLGVTYGIHISNRYATELKNGTGAEDAIRKTMRETGKGVFAAALTTIAGFGVMGFSKILPMYQFGVITALAIFFGYIGSIFVLPALLVIWGRRAGPKLAAGTETKTEQNA